MAISLMGTNLSLLPLPNILKNSSSSIKFVNFKLNISFDLNPLEYKTYSNALSLKPNL